MLDHFSVGPVRAGKVKHFRCGTAGIHLLVGGVGMMETAFHLATALRDIPVHHAIQAGIAGAFDRKLNIGDIVRVDSQRYGDLGTRDSSGFSDVFDLGLTGRNEPPFENAAVRNSGPGRALHDDLEAVGSITVNQVTTEPADIDRLVGKYGPEVESMEGLAFHYACSRASVSYAEIRSVSNYIAPKAEAQWNIPKAVETLNDYLIAWLDSRC